MNDLHLLRLLFCLAFASLAYANCALPSTCIPSFQLHTSSVSQGRVANFTNIQTSGDCNFGYFVLDAPADPLAFTGCIKSWSRTVPPECPSSGISNPLFLAISNEGSCSTQNTLETLVLFPAQTALGSSSLYGLQSSGCSVCERWFVDVNNMPCEPRVEPSCTLEECGISSTKIATSSLPDGTTWANFTLADYGDCSIANLVVDLPVGPLMVEGCVDSVSRQFPSNCMPSSTAQVSSPLLIQFKRDCVPSVALLLPPSVVTGRVALAGMVSNIRDCELCFPVITDFSICPTTAPPATSTPPYTTHPTTPSTGASSTSQMPTTSNAPHTERPDTPTSTGTASNSDCRTLVCSPSGVCDVVILEECCFGNCTTCTAKIGCIFVISQNPKQKQCLPVTANLTQLNEKRVITNASQCLVSASGDGDDVDQGALIGGLIGGIVGGLALVGSAGAVAGAGALMALWWKSRAAAPMLNIDPSSLPMPGEGLSAENPIYEGASSFSRINPFFSG